MEEIKRIVWIAKEGLQEIDESEELVTKLSKKVGVLNYLLQALELEIKWGDKNEKN